MKKLLMIMLVLFLYGCDSNETTEDVETEKTYSLGETLVYKTFEITFIGSRVTELEMDDGSIVEAIFIDSVIKNNGDLTAGIDSYDSEVLGPDSEVVGTLLLYTVESVESIKFIRSGATLEGPLVYRYVGDGDYTVTFGNSKVVIPVSADKEVKVEYDFENNYSLNLTGDEYEMGETFSFNKVDITLLGVEVVEDWELIGNSGDKVVVKIAIHNINDEIWGLNIGTYQGFGVNGTTVRNYSYCFENEPLSGPRILPGATTISELIFEYDGDGSYIIEFSGLSDPIDLVFDVEKGVVFESDKVIQSNYKPVVNPDDSTIGDVFVFDGFELSVISMAEEEFVNDLNETISIVKVHANIKNVSDQGRTLDRSRVFYFLRDGTVAKSMDSYFDDSIYHMTDIDPEEEKLYTFNFEMKGEGTYFIGLRLLREEALIHFSIGEYTYPENVIVDQSVEGSRETCN